MILNETPISGIWLVDLAPLRDERGFFARTYCQEIFKSYGIESNWVQANVSFNAQTGTLRGLHYQTAPYEEAKLVRVSRGRIFDVMVDLRPDSTTFGQTFSHELDASSMRSLYIPTGIAHGFQTLEPDSEVTYLMSQVYSPAHTMGLHWQDPDLAIAWPLPFPVVSPRDATHPFFKDVFQGVGS
ncbi:dTDP-4-dehydrorhamnose 3,5-epimerase [Laribacter hongkongensis]|uniref:dTDP-4-dehydrorhamnose 3,5-epimerase n=1 Tax=Laribacter hongkongensis TaxID=168471 RepID=UPI0005A022C6|nr:dTDP-4-dehydrorhamnose 3,5-epimerase [Laribacter hongkongensis]